MSQTLKWRIDEASIVTVAAFLFALFNLLHLIIFQDGQMDSYATSQGLNDAQYLSYALAICLSVYLIRFSISFEVFSNKDKKTVFVGHMPKWLQVTESTIRIGVGIFLILGITDQYQHFGSWIVEFAISHGAERPAGPVIGNYALPPITSTLILVSGYVVCFFICCLVWDVILLVGACFVEGGWKPIKQKMREILSIFMYSHLFNLAVWLIALALWIHQPLMLWYKLHLTILGMIYTVLLFITVCLAFIGAKSNCLEYVRHLKQ